MATTQEISTRALRRIKVLSPDESLSGDMLTSATEALTAMVNSWEAEGLSGDILPIDARFEQGLVAMLAVRMAEEFGKEPGPVLLRDADMGWKAIQAAFFAVPKSTFDRAVTYTGPDLGQGIILGQTTEGYADWAASTEYELRDFVINEKALYECITAGTSASSGGPAGTDAEITDGTVEWCFRRVTA